MNAIITKPDTDVIDISIAPGKIKKFRIDGDDNRIIRLDVSDNNVAVRASERIPALKELEQQIRDFGKSSEDEDGDDVEARLVRFATEYKNIDSAMKAHIDYIFNADVSEACCNGASMYDIIDGYMRYEIIFDQLRRLYDAESASELKKVKERVAKHTAKYNK